MTKPDHLPPYLVAALKAYGQGINERFNEILTAEFPKDAPDGGAWETAFRDAVGGFNALMEDLKLERRRDPVTATGCPETADMLAKGDGVGF